MWNPKKNMANVGKYLAGLIDRTYPSRRSFCRAYLCLTGDEPTEEALSNMSNRLSQIIKGKKSIQVYDLPYFCHLLVVSCEQILSAGTHDVPSSDHLTNYSIARSTDPAEWEAYILRADKLILNCDEYCKTVIDYALEFGNHAFLKYLMDHEYIWFDSRNDQDYVMTFGAGTSIQRRHIGSVDYGLQSKLAMEDSLRIRMIDLALDHNDLQMLDALRARELPELYRIARFHATEPSMLHNCFHEDLLCHIAVSSEEILDYFTDPFPIPDMPPCEDQERSFQTFLFPDISRLLDQLIAVSSPFTETAIKKALKHNKNTYQRLCSLASCVKHDESGRSTYGPDLWVQACEQDLTYQEEGCLVQFRAFYSTIHTRKVRERVAANVARISTIPASPILKHLAEELNESHDAIRDLKYHLKEVIQ